MHFAIDCRNVGSQFLEVTNQIKYILQIKVNILLTVETDVVSVLSKLILKPSSSYTFRNHDRWYC
jgi:hypothetical protein